MRVSPFTFYRGAVAVTAADLANKPRGGLQVPLFGDAHPANFGVFAAPDRRLVFSINDFDKTLPGPLEWDVKRLGAGFALAGRGRGFDEKQPQAASDVMLGWLALDDQLGVKRDFHVRQLWDAKRSGEIDAMRPRAMTVYARLCGWTPARAHSRSGGAVAIASYLGLWSVRSVLDPAGARGAAPCGRARGRRTGQADHRDVPW